MRELALFAGAGGGILGGEILGWRTVCAVERDAHCASVLAQRQNDGCLRPFPIWSDVCSFDGRPWRGAVDVVSGGFPCQDISPAGKGAGIRGERSGLWAEFARIVGDVRPGYVWVENSSALSTRGSTSSLPTWPRSGSMRSGACWEQMPSASLTNGRGCGSSLPTPSGVNGGRNHTMGRVDEWGGSSNPLRGTVIGSMCSPEFEELVMGWPIGWTEPTPFEMARFREWLQEHSESCMRDLSADAA